MCLSGLARQRWGEMNSKRRLVRTEEDRAGENHLSGNEQVRREIQRFLQALRSYPERFARNPRLTFEEHCSGFARTAKAEPRRRV
jgi:hypothetical protein